jgi:hypothetical protein
VREQRVVLEHHVHGPSMWWHTDDIFPVEQYAAFGWHLEAGKHA